MRPGQPLWPRFLATHLIVNMATVGPVGRIRHAPGTWGSLAGLVYFIVFFTSMGWLGYLIASALGLYLAVAFCGEAEFRLGQNDPGMVVLDEFMAMPLCFVAWRALPAEWFVGGGGWAIFLAGFLLFRLFDILKPFGIARLQHLPGGWGVVADDAAAALATSAVLHAAGFAWRVWL